MADDQELKDEVFRQLTDWSDTLRNQGDVEGSNRAQNFAFLVRTDDSITGADAISIKEAALNGDWDLANAIANHEGPDSGSGGDEGDQSEGDDSGGAEGGGVDSGGEQQGGDEGGGGEHGGDEGGGGEHGGDG